MFMRISLLTALLVLMALRAIPAGAQTAVLPTLRPLATETWTATDALGRTTAANITVRKPHAKRFVGIFYFLTHGSRAYYDHSKENLNYGTFGDDPRVLRDNTQIIATSGSNPVINPGAWKDAGAYWWGGARCRVLSG